MSAFQITLFGIVTIGIYSFGIWLIAIVLSRAFATFRRRWWILGPPMVAMMALPWAEEIWIASNFMEACKGAGVTVYRQVEVEGYLDRTDTLKRESIRVGPQFNANPTQQAEFEKRGYRFVEQSLDDGSARHLEREGDRVMVTIREIPEARYEIKHHFQPRRYHNDEPIGWKITKNEFQAADRKTGEILGKDTTIKRYPNYAESLWLRYFGTGMVLCYTPLSDGNKIKRIGSIEKYVFIPKKPD